jgi:hypothetical protein
VRTPLVLPLLVEDHLVLLLLLVGNPLVLHLMVEDHLVLLLLLVGNPLVLHLMVEDHLVLLLLLVGNLLVLLHLVLGPMDHAPLLEASHLHHTPIAVDHVLLQ